MYGNAPMTFRLKLRAQRYTMHLERTPHGSRFEKIEKSKTRKHEKATTQLQPLARYCASQIREGFMFQPGESAHPSGSREEQDARAAAKQLASKAASLGTAKFADAERGR